MNLFINKVISSILQIILFAIIPFIWWCITARKQQSFTKWIGLKKIVKTIYVHTRINVKIRVKSLKLPCFPKIYKTPNIHPIKIYPQIYTIYWNINKQSPWQTPWALLLQPSFQGELSFRPVLQNMNSL